MAAVADPMPMAAEFSHGSSEAALPSPFDYGSIHPSHGVAHDGSFVPSSAAGDDQSAAEKLLAALASQESHSDFEDDSMNLTYSSTTSEGESSDSSLDTPFSSFASSHSPLDAKASSYFFHKAAQSTFPHHDGHSAYSPYHSPHSPAVPTVATHDSMSSCYFSAHVASALAAHPIVPLDSALHDQLSQSLVRTSSSSSATSANGDDTASISSASSTSTVTPASHELQSNASTSSGMMRSFSAPAHTAFELAELRARWNAEASTSAAAAATSGTGVAGGMARSGSQQAMAGPMRPGMQRRNTSGSMASRSRRDKGKGRADAPYQLAGASTGSDGDSGDEQIPIVDTTFSSRTHLLSPVKKSSPFKRSRVAAAYTQWPAIYEDPREEELYAQSPPSLSRAFTYSPSQPMYPASPVSSAAPSPGRAPGLPKSPTRPTLNRFFTSPELFA